MRENILLYANYTNLLSYFNDWVDAFKYYEPKKFNCYNVCCSNLHKNLNFFTKLENAELIVLHHSMLGDTSQYLTPFISCLKQRKGKLVSFVGNEVNLPIFGVAQKILLLQQLKPEIIATQLLKEAGEWLYSDCKSSRVVSIPHALNPNKFAISSYNYSNRNIDIGVRSAKYGTYIGDNDRNNIINYFDTHKSNYDLVLDLGNAPNAKLRFARDEWFNFLSSCKGTIATEAGSFYLEKDDKTVNNIVNFIKNDTKKIVLSNDNKLIAYLLKLTPNFCKKILKKFCSNYISSLSDIDSDYDFDYIYNKFFKNLNKCPVYSKAISSRHFDAVGTKTLQIMFPGRYNDILIPNEHYVALNRDFSNIEDVIKILKNPNKTKQIVENTYSYVLNTHTHKHRVDYLLSLL